MVTASEDPDPRVSAEASVTMPVDRASVPVVVSVCRFITPVSDPTVPALVTGTPTVDVAPLAFVKVPLDVTLNGPAAPPSLRVTPSAKVATPDSVMPPPAAKLTELKSENGLELL